MDKNIIYWIKANNFKKNCKYLLIYICIFLISNYFGNSFDIFLSKKYEYNSILIKKSLILLHIIITFNLVTVNIKKFLCTNEISFLKGLSYTNIQITSIGFFKQRYIFYILSIVYGILNFRRSIFLIFINLLKYFMLYLAVYEFILLVFLTINIYSIYKGIKIILASMFLVILAYCLYINFNFKIADLSLVFEHVINSIFIKFLINNLYDNLYFITTLFIILSISLILIVRKVHIYTSLVNSTTNRFNNIKDLLHKKNKFKSPVISHILKDFFSLTRNMDFLLLQILSFCIYLVVVLFNNDYIIYFIISIIVMYLNTMYSQVLYKIEASNFMIYQQLPIKYKEYVCCKIISVLFISTYQFIILYSFKCFIFPKLILIIITLVIIALFLSIYYNSILIMFYPNIEKTNIPILIGNFLMIVPFLPFAIIYIALKNGYKNWKKYFYE